MKDQEVVKSIFIEHSGFNETHGKSDIHQDIIHFVNDEKITMDTIAEKVKHRYSVFRRDKTITIIRIQTL